MVLGIDDIFLTTYFVCMIIVFVVCCYCIKKEFNTIDEVINI